MDLLSFGAGAVTVLVSILVGYFFGRGKPPEDLVSAVKRTVRGVKMEGAVLTNPEPEDEQVAMRAQWHNDLKKNRFTEPPEGLILTEDEKDAMSA